MARAYKDAITFDLPSYKVAQNHPRSAKFYLSFEKYIKMVGKFSTLAHFSDFLPHDTVEKKTDSKKSKSKIDTNKNKNDDSTANMTEEEKADAKPKKKHDEEKGPLAQVKDSKKPDDIKNIVKMSSEVLAKAKCVFPIDLFPDTIWLDRTKITITKRSFFFSSETISIRIEDVLNASVHMGPWLGSLTIASRVLSSEDHFTINYLKRSDVIRLKHMIQGYVIALHNDIEVSHLPKKELIKTLTDLGQDDN